MGIERLLGSRLVNSALSLAVHAGQFQSFPLTGLQLYANLLVASKKGTLLRAAFVGLQVIRLSSQDVPTAYAFELEAATIVQPEQVIEAVHKVVGMPVPA